MAVQPAQYREIVPVALTGAEATYLTVQVSPAYMLLKLEGWLCNTHTAAVTVSLYAVPSGGSIGVANQIYADSIPAKKSIPFTAFLNLAAGGTIRGLASTAGVVSMRLAPMEV